MNQILGYIRQYLVKVDWVVHLLTVLLLAVLIFINYTYRLNDRLYDQPYPLQLGGWYLLLLTSFAVPYLLLRFTRPLAFPWRKHFVALLLVAPLVFAWKMTAQVHPFKGFADADFWNQVVYFPAKIAGILGSLLLLRRWAGPDPVVMGLRTPAGGMRPYWLMLLLMVPLVLLAASQPDFQRVYPKVRHVLPALAPLGKVLAFELSYGSDFFTIELFFRGFLVVYCSRWAGRYAILPMAAFYCVIHFGKPLGECISSFFGGMLLGIVSYRTQSIWGGLVVHLGIAWLMELAGAYPLF